MTNKQDNWFERLREMADHTLQKRSGRVEKIDPSDLTRLIDDIQVFQVELDLQNEELRRSLEELEKSRTRFSRLFDMAPAGYVVLDESGMILQVNQTLLNLLGKNPDALMGKPFSRFVDPKDQGVFLSRFKAIYRHPEDKTIDVRLVNDHRFVCHARLQGGFIPFETAPGKPDIDQFCLIVTDITAAKTAENDLKRYARYLNERNKELNCLFSISRLISNPDLGVDDIMDGAVNFVKNAFQFPDQICGCITLFEKTYATPDFHPTRQHLSRDIRLKNQRIGHIDIYCDPDMPITGDSPFLEEEKALINAVALRLGHAIEGIHAEKQEKKTRHYLETILKTTVDGFWVLDMQGVIIEANDAFCQMTGYPKETILGMTIRDLDDLESPEMTAERIERIVTRGSEFFETRHRRKDGTTFPMEVSTTWLPEDNGRLICFGRDITERKQAEKRILHLQKSESLGRMGGAMAHHYNNLLTSVMGNLEMAMGDLPDDHPISGNLEHAMHAARRISKLGATMLTYLGQTNTPRKRLDLSEICQAAIPALQADIPENIGFKTQFPFPGPVVLANAGEITQILTSLVTNAREALAEQPGTIVVNIRPVSSGSIPTGTQCFPMDFQPAGSDFACIRVQDSGPGISDTMLEKIFDPFYSTRFTGRGLGLPIVLGTVKSLGGCITVSSDPGSGTIFQVFIPISG